MSASGSASSRTATTTSSRGRPGASAPSSIGSSLPSRSGATSRTRATSSSRSSGSGCRANAILHVAQSLFHDHVPAKALGLTTVWIDRRHDRPGTGRRRQPRRRPTRRSPIWPRSPRRPPATGARPRSRRLRLRGARATRTGTGALLTTRSDTLPITSRSIPRRPWVPTTMRSTDSATAASTIASPGSPSQMRQRIGTPSRCPRSTIRWAAASRLGPDLVDALSIADTRQPLAARDR